MEDSWLFIDDDDKSSVHSLVDSDIIDSETEAELYSKIHHEENLTLKGKSSELIFCSSLKNDIFCIDKGNNESTPKKLNSAPLSNQISCDNFSSEKRKSEMDTNCKNLNSLKKHKSADVRDSPSVILDSNDLEKKESNSLLKNDTFLLDSSDSDDIYFVEPSTENSDLRINLLKEAETIFLNSSSNSDSDEEVTSAVLKRDSFLKNLSMPNLRIGENSKGLWHINYEDSRRSRKHSHRYHDNDSVTCSNCNRKGHVFRSCPSPRVIKCFVCGGGHLGYKCAKRMCSNCYTSGHDRKNCYRRIKSRVCFLCNIEGHTKANCPDLWRRYHLTTKPSSLNVGKLSKEYVNLYCWNCGKSGHFGAVCPVLHHSNSSLNTWPCVISYDNPKHLLNDRLSLLRNSPLFSVTQQNKHSDSFSGPSAEKNINYKFRNEMNVSRGSNEENVGNKRRRRGKLGTALRFGKVQDIIKEKDFPRTPKKDSPIKQPKTFIMFKNEPESVKTLMNNQLRKLKKQWKTQGASLQHSESQETVTQSGASKFKTDNNLPESIQLRVLKIFNKWKNNRMKRIKKLQKNKGKNIS